MRNVHLLLIISCLLGMTMVCSAGDVLLAVNKSATMPIVISEKAAKNTQEVAAELARYLEKISGAKFSIKTGDGKTGIVLGTLAEFPNPSLKKPLEIRNFFDGREAYAIRTEPRRVLLIGATEKGASHAAFRLLTVLGCRRFFPTPEWEVVPTLDTIRVNVNESSRPALPFRRIWATKGWWTIHQDDYFVAWQRFNRMNESFTLYANHAWPSIYLDNKAEFEKHPEYFAMVNGKRNTNPDYLQFCVSNPALRKLVVDTILESCAKYPQDDMHSVEANDGGGFCECENCKKLGTQSDQIFGLANEVARAVAKKYPGKMIGLLAYGEHSDPPSLSLEPNVYVQLTSGFNYGKYSHEELLALWPKKTKNFGEYVYFTELLWDWERPTLSFAADVKGVQKLIRHLVATGGTSIDCESGIDWGPFGRGFYAATQMMWDPNLDLDALLKDFYDKAFGPAAVPVQRWYERFDPGNKQFYTEDMLARAFRDLKEASRLAEHRRDVQARLDYLKLYMEYLRLRWHYEHDADTGKRKQAAFDELRLIYRTKDRYIVHERGLLRNWSGMVADEFNEPTWSGYNDVPHPYVLDKPYTHEEIEVQFQQGLADFAPVDLLPEKKFSTDLVPVRFAGTTSATALYVSQYLPKWVFYIYKNEPFAFDLQAGGMYKNKPDVVCSVQDATGKEVTRALVPTDQQKHHIELKVPRQGMYFLTFNTAAGAILWVPQERPFQMALTKDEISTCGVMPPSYFYVPKGTKQFQFITMNGSTLYVYGPDGKVVKEVKGGQQYVLVDVPKGMDGKPWSFVNSAFGRIWFRNLPNYLASSPNALMLPKELVKSDGLQSPVPLEVKPVEK